MLPSLGWLLLGLGSLTFASGKFYDYCTAPKDDREQLQRISQWLVGAVTVTVMAGMMLSQTMRP